MTKNLTIKMKKFLISILLIVLSIGNLHAQLNSIIEIKRVEKTDSSIIIEGITHLIPSNTKINVSVQQINGKILDERHIIETVEDVFTTANGSFIAELKRFGSLNGYDYPAGKYQLRFFANFNRTWQTIEVAQKVGVKLDEQGRSDLGEPHFLPKSTDLVTGLMGVRNLRAIRTITIPASVTKFSTYKTKIIRIEIHDSNAKYNPIRTYKGTDLLVQEVKQKIGHLKLSQGVSIMCIGDFKNGFGYLASDLYHSGGGLNMAFVINNGTTLAEVCHQQEDDLIRQRKLRGLPPV